MRVLENGPSSEEGIDKALGREPERLEDGQKPETHGSALSSDIASFG
jgi:hypothetical protein